MELTEQQIISRLLVAVLLSGLIGFERERAHKKAGVRTHSLVALGACLATIISLGISPERPDIIANVLIGIGFIGGSAILRDSKKHFTGATTAASIWLVAALGIASGAGYYYAAIAATLLGYVILTVMWFIEKKIAWKMGYQHTKLLDDLNIPHNHNVKRKSNR